MCFVIDDHDSRIFYISQSLGPYIIFYQLFCFQLGIKIDIGLDDTDEVDRLVFLICKKDAEYNVVQFLLRHSMVRPGHLQFLFP